MEIACIGPRNSPLIICRESHVMVVMESHNMSQVRDDKSVIRNQIWTYLEEHDIARFPRPVYHRIPNFVGSEEAGRRLSAMKEFEQAKTVKVNPDSPQKQVRLESLLHGKVLLMPTPRLRSGFICLDHSVPRDKLRLAASIRGAFILGKKIPLAHLAAIDLVVVGSVAVAEDGGRIGKGEGYSEIEYAILRELELLNDSTPVVTTVHDSQIVRSVPLEAHDLSVDYIVTPTRILKTNSQRPRPAGIIWSKITADMMESMPVLAEIMGRRRASRKSDQV